MVLFPGNFEPKSLQCAPFEAMKESLNESSGFEYVIERGNKGGYIGLKPGDYIKFRINTNLDVMDVHVGVAYLASYEHMGVARAECHGGCTCDAKDVNSLHQEHNSVTAVMKLKVTKPPEFIISFTILSSQNAENKFKILAIIVSDDGIISGGLGHYQQHGTVT
jgi:hypothetical protein